jgi:hypothetical protein
MRNYFLKLSFVLLTVLSVFAHAGKIGKEVIPEKIMAQLHKQHPNALDITAEPKTHFGQVLYALYFKDGDADQIELYRADGHFYVSGEKIDALNLIPPAVNDNLKAAFNNYEIKRAILVVNPNGVGEEYDLALSASGKNWSVSVDGKGAITDKVED